MFLKIYVMPLARYLAGEFEPAPLPTDEERDEPQPAGTSRQQAEEQLAKFRQYSTTRFLDEGWWLPFLVAVLLGGALPLFAAR